MMRLAVILCLLCPGVALAGQATSGFGVSILITGNGNSRSADVNTGAYKATAGAAQAARAPSLRKRSHRGAPLR